MYILFCSSSLDFLFINKQESGCWSASILMLIWNMLGLRSCWKGRFYEQIYLTPYIYISWAWLSKSSFLRNIVVYLSEWNASWKYIYIYAWLQIKQTRVTNRNYSWGANRSKRAETIKMSQFFLNAITIPCEFVQSSITKGTHYACPTVAHYDYRTNALLSTVLIIKVMKAGNRNNAAEPGDPIPQLWWSFELPAYRWVKNPWINGGRPVDKKIC